MKVKLIEDALIFVEIAKLFLEVIGDVERLHGLVVIAYVPDVHGQVVAGEEVIVAGWRELGHSHGLNDVSEEVLARGGRLEFELARVVRILTRHS